MITHSDIRGTVFEPRSADCHDRNNGMKIIASQLASVLSTLSITLLLLLSISSASASTTYTYTSSRLTSATGGEAGTYTYNANGSMTGLTQGGTAYTLAYDWMHNITSYKAGALTLASFTYDGYGTHVRDILIVPPVTLPGLILAKSLLSGIELIDRE